MQHRAGFYEKYIKRLLDIVLSGAALVILSPVLLITAVLVRIKLGSPVIFTQERPGKDEKVFKLHKFRSMTDARDENGNLLPDKDRLTGFGKKLRSLSIDELPELWDIFRGKMSIVGPRPLLVKYLPYYTDEERHRHVSMSHKLATTKNVGITTTQLIAAHRIIRGYVSRTTCANATLDISVNAINIPRFTSQRLYVFHGLRLRIFLLA